MHFLLVGIKLPTLALKFIRNYTRRTNTGVSVAPRKDMSFKISKKLYQCTTKFFVKYLLWLYHRNDIYWPLFGLLLKKKTRNNVIFQIYIADSYIIYDIICVAVTWHILILLIHFVYIGPNVCQDLTYFISISTLCFYWSKCMSRLDTLYFY